MDSGFVILIIIGILLIWIPYLISSANDKKVKEREERERREREERERREREERERREREEREREKREEREWKGRTSDAEFALINGMWVCPYCETLNKREDNKCVACEMEKN